MSGTTLHDRLADATIRLEPFPHIVVPDALDPALYRQLCAGFPPFSRIGWANSRPPRSNSKYELSAAMMMGDATMPEAWRTFAALHSDRAFFDSVAALFDAHWPAALRQALGGTLDGLRSTPAWRRSAALPLERRPCRQDRCDRASGGERRMRRHHSLPAESPGFLSAGVAAIYGVSVRRPAPHFRCYMLITAQRADDGLVSPITG